MEARGMKRILRVLSVLLVLAGNPAVIALPALAQEPIHLRAVEPPEGRPGQELQLTVWGRGFGDAQEVGLNLADLQVLNVWIESDEAIKADVFVPEDAPPGPRTVEVIAVFGPEEEYVAGLEGGFAVLEQEPQPSPVVDRVEPQQVGQGSQVELGVFGRGFAPGAWIEIEGEGVYVDEVEFISPEHLLAFLEVEEGAPPGWRRVVVINPDDQAGERTRALEVLGEAPPAGPPVTPTPPPEDGTPVWPWVGGAVVLLGAGVAIGRALNLRTRLTWKQTAQLQWQLEAETELPEPKKMCTWACRAKVTADMLKRWQVTALELTPYPQPRGKTPPVKRIEGTVLDPLTEAAQPLHIAEGETQIRQRVARVVEALLEQLLAWEREGQTPASVRIDARLSRDIKCQFKLYHCEQAGAKLDWVDSGIKWTGTLHRPGGEHLGVVRGPTAGEPDFSGRVRQELEGFLVQLVRSVRFKV
jgi:hypothetical protein